MAKKKKEVAEEATDKNITKIKIQKEEQTITKVNLDEKKEEINETTEKVAEDNTDNSGVVELVEDANTEEKQEEIQPEVEAQEQPVIEEVTDEKVEQKTEELIEEVKEAVVEAKETGKQLPDNIKNLMQFMEETGGDVEDYVKINQDYSKLNDSALLREYYKQTKKHLDDDEISFLIDDSFSYDETEDEEKEIKKKKIAFKEQVASAKAHLDGQKSKYYKEIKAGSKLTQEQQQAVDFFSRYNKESEESQKTAERQAKTFRLKSDNLFNKNFKGFEYNVGDKRYRFNVKNTSEVKEAQSDITNFTKKFLNKNNEIDDAAGYHKSLFTAMNSDAVARHFYEQGKADALKQSIAKAKNVDMNPRQAFGEVEASGVKVKVLGNNSNDFKFKIKNNK